MKLQMSHYLYIKAYPKGFTATARSASLFHSVIFARVFHREPNTYTRLSIQKLMTSQKKNITVNDVILMKEEIDYLRNKAQADADTIYHQEVRLEAERAVRYMTAQSEAKASKAVDAYASYFEQHPHLLVGAEASNIRGITGLRLQHPLDRNSSSTSSITELRPDNSSNVPVSPIFSGEDAANTSLANISIESLRERILRMETQITYLKQQLREREASIERLYTQNTKKYTPASISEVSVTRDSSSRHHATYRASLPHPPHLRPRPAIPHSHSTSLPLPSVQHRAPRL